MSIEVIGFKKYSRRIKVLLKNLRQNAIPTIREEVDDMRREAQGFAAVDTGTMRDSTRKEDILGGASLISGGADFINPKSEEPVFYARFQEFGTINQSPQPFFFPAVLGGLPKLRRRLFNQTLAKKT